MGERKGREAVDEMKDTMASGRKVGQSGERKEGQGRKKGRTYTKIEKQTVTENQEREGKKDRHKDRYTGGVEKHKGTRGRKEGQTSRHKHRRGGKKNRGATEGKKGRTSIKTDILEGRKEGQRGEQKKYMAEGQSGKKEGQTSRHTHKRGGRKNRWSSRRMEGQYLCIVR